MTGPENSPIRDGGDYMDNPALRGTADQLHRVMHSGQMRPAFRERLRAEVVAARAEAIAEGTARLDDVTPAEEPGPARRGLVRRPLWHRPLWHRPLWRPSRIAWVAAAAAVLVAGAVAVVQGVPFLGRPGPVSVTALSDVNAALSVDPAAPLRLRFTHPLDHAATQAALRLTPAATMHPSWQGDTLTVTPEHGFAPNAAYVLTIDHTLARTATGAPLAADMRVVFGTAPVPGVGRRPTTPVALERTPVASAADGSEAVVARDGSLLLTAAQPGPATNYRQGLVRINNNRSVDRLSATTDAICVSRSGSSIAFLTHAGSGSRVVFADGTGTPLDSAPVVIDQGSPLGWIDDAEVSYVGGGRLRAVDRSGHVRVLSDSPVDPAHDTVVLSPGGRYVYLRPATGTSGSGRIIDLQTGAARPLPGITGDPAFSADGATVIWIDGSGPTPRIAVAATGGGPALTAPLPVQPGDSLSDLSLSPDGSHFVYSLTRPDHHGELRLAALPDGNTLAVSPDGIGQSPNWSSSGRLFTVLSSGTAGPRIDTVTVADQVADRQASLEATASAFANAQISADPGAQHALAVPGMALPTLPHVTRAEVLWVLPSPDGTATARVRLTIDPRPDDPVVKQAEETLTLDPRSGTRPPTVRAVTAGPFQPAPPGPALTHLDTDASPGAVQLTFDSDLDPATVATALTLTAPDGRPIPSTATYDPPTRTVTLRPASPGTTAMVVRIGTGLRDTNGHASNAAVQVPILGG